MYKPQTPPIISDYEIFKKSCDYMYQAGVAQAYGYLSSKSEDWLKQNIPIVEYKKEIANYIFGTTACIALTENVSVFLVNGQWQRIIEQ